jgi:hypothetical protein
LKASDYIAIVAVLISLCAIFLSVRQERIRRADVRQQRVEDAYAATISAVRARVLDLLVTADAGVRTVEALVDNEDSEQRIKLLRRTAVQLWAVGETDLADGLRQLCQAWGDDPKSVAAKQERERFLNQVQSIYAPGVGASDGNTGHRDSH